MKLGIVGGGQLGRMMALAARPLGIDVMVVEPAPEPPTAKVAEVIAAPYDDRDALARLARQCDVVTVELEGVDTDALDALRSQVAVHPNPALVAMSADRLAEKRALRSLGIRTAPFDDEATVPAIVKTRRGGYDGKGQVRVTTAAELSAALAELPEPITESVVAFEREVSIIAARALDGSMAFSPLIENSHRDGILRLSVPRPDLDARDAEAAITRVCEHYGVVGVITIEWFATADGLVANELAPRVHNSGHWSIEAAEVSQFAQHVRAVCGLPLGSMAPTTPCAMVNLIGTPPSTADVLAVPGAHLHLYDKAPRPGRKVGHVTVTAADHDELWRRVARVQALVEAAE